MLIFIRTSTLLLLLVAAAVCCFWFCYQASPINVRLLVVVVAFSIMRTVFVLIVVA